MADEIKPKASPLDPLPSTWGGSRWAYGLWNPLLAVSLKGNIDTTGTLSTGAVIWPCAANVHVHSAATMGRMQAAQASAHIHSAGKLNVVLQAKTGPAHIHFFGSLEPPPYAGLPHIHSKGVLTSSQFLPTSGQFHIHFLGSLNVVVQAGAQAHIHSGSRCDFEPMLPVSLEAQIHTLGTLPYLIRLWYARALYNIHTGDNDCYIEVPNLRFIPPPRVPVKDRSGAGGGTRYVSSQQVPAICPRCGFRYLLSQMREEIFDQRPTGRRVCPECWDEDDPHLQIKDLDLTDQGTVRDPLPHPQQQSVEYTSARNPLQWGEAIETVLGPFFIWRGESNVTPPSPPVGAGRELAQLDGAMARAMQTASGKEKGETDGRQRLGRAGLERRRLVTNSRDR